MKMLNLDDIALDSNRKIVWKGKEYRVKDFDVGEFIQFQTLFNQFQASYHSNQADDLAKVAETASAIAVLGIEDWPEDAISRMNPVQMLAVVSMVANLLPEPDSETKEGVVAEEKKEGASPEPTVE